MGIIEVDAICDTAGEPYVHIMHQAKHILVHQLTTVQ